jgi:hypothetical protein
MHMQATKETRHTYHFETNRPSGTPLQIFQGLTPFIAKNWCIQDALFMQQGIHEPIQLLHLPKDLQAHMMHQIEEPIYQSSRRNNSSLTLAGPKF